MSNYDKYLFFVKNNSCKDWWNLSLEVIGFEYIGAEESSMVLENVRIHVSKGDGFDHSFFDIINGFDSCHGTGIKTSKELIKSYMDKGYQQVSKKNYKRYQQFYIKLLSKYNRLKI